MRSADRDLHVLKYFSAVITVSQGQVINVTDPSLRACPLASHFYPEFRNAEPEDPASVKRAVREVIEAKVRNYGFFTDDRSFHFPRCVVPYGASEMLSVALKNQFLEAAVVVCDGAGTVIVRSPEIVQGIGARMNSLIFTSPLKGVLEKLDQAGCRVIFRDTAWIDQAKGVEKALSLGYGKIGVTVTGFAADQLARIRELEQRARAEVTLLAVCTSGISGDRIETIRRHADLVWACASSEVRERLGPSAKVQLSKRIPVYALTDRGVAFAAVYLNDPCLVRFLDLQKQYRVSTRAGLRSTFSGSLKTRTREKGSPTDVSNAPCHEPAQSQRGEG